MSKKKIKVGVIFGGRSGEHEVSLVSAESVIKNLDRTKYEVISIGITKRGEWIIESLKLKVEGLKLLEKFKKGGEIKGTRLPPKEIFEADVIFPIVHGTYGEDGTLQGFLEMLGLPYVGAGVLGSAIGIDKVAQKKLWTQTSLPIVPYLACQKENFSSDILRRIEKELSYPVFVKPACLGSSVGISKAHNQKELKKGIKLAFKYDEKILVEKAILNAREIECAVLGNEKPRASVPGEVVSSNEFYDYDAKYVDNKSKTLVPADLSANLREKVRILAVLAFKEAEGAGMARIDFLLNNKTKELFLNEINTIPGFTAISMYPKLWAASGLPYQKLLDELIKLAMARHQKKQKLSFSYQPKKKWY